jgi:ribosomal protein L19E
MSKAARIDPLVHYSRRVRELEAKIGELTADKVEHESTIQTLRQQMEHYRTEAEIYKDLYRGLVGKAAGHE